MAYEDIAVRLKISLAKVKTDIHRGREALRKRLMASGAAEELGGFCGAPSLCCF
jgi:RNA polymerase sigma-70 factor (ECF subfamily)